MGYMVQIGEVVMRDPITGEPLDIVVPIYARSRDKPTQSGMTRGEEKLLTDAAGIFMDLLKEQSEIKKFIL